MAGREEVIPEIRCLHGKMHLISPSQPALSSAPFDTNLKVMQPDVLETDGVNDREFKLQLVSVSIGGASILFPLKANKVSRAATLIDVKII